MDSICHKHFLTWVISVPWLPIWDRSEDEACRITNGYIAWKLGSIVQKKISILYHRRVATRYRSFADFVPWWPKKTRSVTSRHAFQPSRSSLQVASSSCNYVHNLGGVQAAHTTLESKHQEQIRTFMAPGVDYGPDLSSSFLQTPPPVSVYPNLPQTAPGLPKGKRTTKDQGDGDECSRCVVFALLTLEWPTYLNFAR